MNQGSLQLEQGKVGYTVVHRPRVTRRIHLELDAQGGLLVVAPRRMSARLINTSLQLRAAHVERFLQRARSRRRDLDALEYRNAERHLYLGERFALRIVERPGKRGKIRLGDRSIHMQLPEASTQPARRALTRWYRRQAQELFAARLAHYCSLAPWVRRGQPVMKLRMMKRTWGSCSSGGVITLNPHLVKAPLDCIDYVVAHEVCHLKEHNHGAAFYSLQEELYPGWREARRLLKDRGHIYLHY